MLLDIIFPQKCLYCGKVGSYICDNCYKKLPNKKCIFKKVNNEYFDYMICDSFYIGERRRLIHNFKFHERAYLYKYFIDIALKKEKISEFLKKFDFITYVPMSYKNQIIRGYNQSELLAKEISKRLGIKLIKTLKKNKNVKIQSTLNEEERRENVKNAFSIIKNLKIENKNIILVDDIFTTGSTVSSASRVLKESNVNKICVFTISKTKLRRLERGKSFI